MHELSIAMGIVDIASDEAKRHGDARVEAVHVKLGALSGVVKDALLFSWELACEDTPVSGARLEIEEVPVGIWCGVCNSDLSIGEELDLRCPVCGTPAEKVLRGRELEVTALEISS